MKYAWSAGEAWAKGTAALLGGTLVSAALLIGVGAVLRRVGVGQNHAAAAAVWLALLAWPTTAILVLLARTGRRAWVATLTALLVLAAAVAAARIA